MGGGCFSLMRCFDGTGWAKSYLYSLFNIIYIMSKLKGSLREVYSHNRLIKIDKRTLDSRPVSNAGGCDVLIR